MTERYLALREGYATLRGEVQSAADKVQTIAQVVPFSTCPPDPAKPSRRSTNGSRRLDDRIMRVVEAGGLSGAVDRTATAIAERAHEAEAALTDAIGRAQRGQDPADRAAGEGHRGRRDWSTAPPRW